MPGNSDPKTQVKSEPGAPNAFLAVHMGHPFVAYRVRGMPGNSDPKTQVKSEPGAPNSFLEVHTGHPFHASTTSHCAKINKTELATSEFCKITARGRLW